MASTATPLIIWGNKFDNYDCVYPDKAAFGKDVIERVWSLGHRKIGIAGILNDFVCYDPMVEFLKKQQAFDPAYLHKSGVRQEHGAEVFEYFMSLPEVPSVIICHSDELAMGLIRAARINGVDIPGKLSVVGADNLRTGAMMLSSLATYDQHFDLMAQKLTEVALKRDRKSVV